MRTSIETEKTWHDLIEGVLGWGLLAVFLIVGMHV